MLGAKFLTRKSPDLEHSLHQTPSFQDVEAVSIGGTLVIPSGLFRI